MGNRALALAALVPMLALGACDDIEGFSGTLTDPDGTSGGTATVRFVNATGAPLDIAENGVVASGQGNIAFGGSTSCFAVNSANPALSVRNAGTTTSLSGLSTNFVNNGSYTVLAYPDASGTTRFAVLSNTYTPGTGSAGLRVFNATTGTFDVYTAGATGAFVTPSATSIATGTGSSFFDVTAGTGQIRFSNAGTTTSALTLTNQVFTAGQTQTLVIAPPATGTTAYRTFVVTGC